MGSAGKALSASDCQCAPNLSRFGGGDYRYQEARYRREKGLDKAQPAL